MNEFAVTGLSFVLFIGAGIAGLLLREALPERHRDHETVEFVKLSVLALVTFLAIVLGLLTASSKAHFDSVSEAYRHLASSAVELDHSLTEAGPDSAPIRADIRAYLAAVIASTWYGEPAPAGEYPRNLPTGQEESRVLSALLSEAESRLHDLARALPDRAGITAEALERFAGLIDARWRVIETGQPTLPTLFLYLMLFWTALVFLGLGLVAKRNAVVAVTMLICTVSLASVVYVILELDAPFSGALQVSSAPLRDALADLDAGAKAAAVR